MASPGFLHRLQLASHKISLTEVSLDTNLWQKLKQKNKIQWLGLQSQPFTTAESQIRHNMAKKTDEK